MQPEFRQVPLTQLRVSATLSQIERREHLDMGAIDELAESITTVGILQPLVVRPVIQGHDKLDLYEIVAGERRYLAAKVAKLESVPVSVRDLTDEQVLEVQLVENLQRADVHPVAEAEGYESLKKLGRTVDEIANKVGKSVAYVYARMKLLDLCKEGRRAFYEGKLTASTALYLARIPVEKLQQQALKEITSGRGGESMSAREAQQHIHDEYMLRLSDAGFKTEDADLVPKAGACGACPKRTGNQAQLFGDVKGADVCTDPVCFKSKLAAHAAILMVAAKANGQTIIQGPAAKKVMPYEHHDHMTGYVKLDERNYNASGTYRQTLGKDYIPTLLVHPYSGKVLEVAPLGDIPKPKSSGSSSSSRPSSASDKADRAKQEAKDALEKAYRSQLLRLVFDKSPPAPGREELLHICGEWGEVDYNFEHLAMALGLGTDTKVLEKAGLTKFLAGLSTAQLGRLVYVWALSLSTGSHVVANGDLEKAAKRLRLDPKKIRADIAAGLKEQAKTPAATAPGKAKSKAKAKTKSPAKKK